MKLDKKKVFPVLIPVLCAVAVVIVFAVSGRISTSLEDRVVENTTKGETVQTTQTAHSKVTLVAVGDNLIHNTLIDAGEKEDGSRDYSSFYENMKSDIENADIAVINQETMLGGKSFEYSGYPMFNTPWEVGEAAINAGFDVFTCATNHSMDVGSAGIEKELEFFSQYPEITSIGVNASEEDYNKITYLEKNNIKFALLNYTYGTNGISIPEDKPYIINMLEEEKVKRDITEARKNADVVIVFPHWGTENSHDINDQQKKYVKIFSDLGVDIVIGTHPHVLQPVEWVTNEETGKKMIVYYSIGNFISHQVNLDQLCGGMAELTSEKNADGVTITNAKLAPVIDFYTSSGNGYKFTVYRLKDYNNDLADKHSQGGATVDYFTNLAKKVVSEEFLDLN